MTSDFGTCDRGIVSWERAAPIGIRQASYHARSMVMKGHKITIEHACRHNCSVVRLIQ